MPHDFPLRPAGHAGTAPAAIETFAREQSEDRRRFQAALAAAVALHLVLFAVRAPDPSTAALAGAKEKPKVYVMVQPKFKPPEVQPQQIPEPRVLRVPIPDPTPDAPEPLRTVEEIEPPRLDLPPSDALFELPQAPPPPPVPDHPIAVGGDVRPPVKIHHVAPAYTELARRAGVRGTVKVRAVIERDGRVTEVKVLKALPLGLDESTVEAVRQWRYEPATLHGKPVAVYLDLRVDFTLN